MELNLKKVDWRQPPHELKANIDGNFTKLSAAMKTLHQELGKETARFKSDDGNFDMSEPKGLELAYGLKLSPNLNIKNIKGAKGEWDALETKSLEAETLKTSKFEADDISIDGNLVYHQEHGSLVFGANQSLETGPYQKTRLRLSPHKDTSAHQSLVVQSAKAKRKPNYQDDTTHFVVKGDGSVGIGAFHKLKSKLTISGEGALLCLRDSMTPTAKEKKSPVGTISWDEEYLYVKTKSGWKRAKLDIL